MTNMVPESSSRHLLGVAISATTLTVPGIGVWPLTPRQPGYDQWEALRDAFAELAVQLRGGKPTGHSGRLAVALMPPLTMLRAVTLPKLRAEDLHAVLTRNVAKYFPSVREPYTVAAVMVGAATTDEYAYTVAAAPASLLAAIEHAAINSGWSVDRFLPAYATWAAMGAARTSAAHGKRDTTSLIIPRDDGGIDVLHVVRGIPHDVRRLRAHDASQEQGYAGAVTIDRPADVAARHATRTRTLELVTGSVRARRRAGTRSIRTILAIAAGVLVIAAGGVYWWQIRHQLAQVTAQHAALAPHVAVAQRAKAALLLVTTPANALSRVEEHGIRWSALLTELTEHLPPDAYISSLNAMGDSATIEATARNGARVFQSVAASPLLKSATPVGPIRINLRNGIGADSNTTDPMEQFTLLVHLPNNAPLFPVQRRGFHP